MYYILASMNYFDSDMSNSTNTVIYFDGKDGNLYLRLWTMSRTIYAAKFEQTIIHQHVHLRRESQSHEPRILVNFIPRLWLGIKY
jgi:calcineurin-like phosphoesterase family protein